MLAAELSSARLPQSVPGLIMTARFSCRLHFLPSLLPANISLLPVFGLETVLSRSCTLLFITLTEILGVVVPPSSCIGDISGQSIYVKLWLTY